MARSEEPLKRIFADESGVAIEFYIHKSVTERKRDKVFKAIEKYGGKVVDNDYGVDTVIVDPGYPEAYTLQNKYNVHSDKRYWGTKVEDTQFVFSCIKLGKFQHRPVKRQSMRGNGPGRMNYTQEDEKLLCRYLAIRTPDPESGGRLGHRIYEELVDLGTLDPEEYGWTLRHPPESWREHYRSKKNRARLDALIRGYIPKLNATEEQLYPFDRRLNSKWPPHPEPVEQHQQENYDEYWQGRNRRRGAKQKAVKQEEEESSDEDYIQEAERSEDEYHRPSSLFSEAASDDVPQQVTESGQSPNARNVSIRRRRIPNEPDNSQATLVGRSHAYKSQIRPSQETRASPPTDERDVSDNEEAERRSMSTSPDATAVAGRAGSPQMPVPPVVPDLVQERTEQAAQAAPVDDAPYRNTRARAVAAPPPIIGRQTRRRDVVIPSSSSPPAMAEEELDRIKEEATGEDLVSPRSKGQKRRRVVEEEFLMSYQQDPTSVPETLKEEADVARLLSVESIRSSTGSGIQQPQQPVHERFSASGKSGKLESSPSPLHQHTESMDTDDEQIDKKLNSSNVPRLAKFGYDTPDPRLALAEFSSSRASGGHRITTSATSSRAARSLLLPKTIKKEHTDDIVVTPLEDLFPLPGTRANVAKKRFEEQRKKEEYIPPSSTRAARAAQIKRSLQK